MIQTLLERFLYRFALLPGNQALLSNIITWYLREIYWRGLADHAGSGISASDAQRQKDEDDSICRSRRTARVFLRARGDIHDTQATLEN